MTRKEIQSSAAYTYHHTGSRRGYISRRANIDDLPAVLVTSGRYKGMYKVDIPRFDTTLYVSVEYYSPA